MSKYMSKYINIKVQSRSGRQVATCRVPESVRCPAKFGLAGVLLCRLQCCLANSGCVS